MEWGSLEGEDLGSWLQDQQHFQCLGVWWGSGEQYELETRKARAGWQVRVQSVSETGPRQWPQRAHVWELTEEIRGEAWVWRGSPRPTCLLHEDCWGSSVTHMLPGIAEGPLCPTCSLGIAEGPSDTRAPRDCWGSSMHIPRAPRGGLLRSSVSHMPSGLLRSPPRPPNMLHGDCWGSSMSHMLHGDCRGSSTSYLLHWDCWGPPCSTALRRLQRVLHITRAHGDSWRVPPHPTCSTQWRAWSLMNVGGIWQKLGSRVTGGSVCGRRAVALAWLTEPPWVVDMGAQLLKDVRTW